ncbi:MAG TPA: ABC transporter ATP-binding protein, partial [Sphingobacteriaceae bacterium]|nr:ABC transporter ATP-binding protein [Sphingobacteriaceae bacterium]
REMDIYYGHAQALAGVSLTVGPQEIVAVLGANGAGKTTLVNTIAGMLRIRRGAIRFEGQSLHELKPHQFCERGIALVPEGRRLFPHMTVRENLEMGAYAPSLRQGAAERMEQVFQLFPVLKQRLNQLAGTMSGGERQMVAIGRALMARPKLLLADEPSLGLAPKVTEALFAALAEINRMGVAILIVEQQVPKALALAHRAYILEQGRVVREGHPPDLLRDPEVKRAYLGHE